MRFSINRNDKISILSLITLYFFLMSSIPVNLSALEPKDIKKEPVVRVFDEEVKTVKQEDENTISFDFDKQNQLALADQQENKTVENKDVSVDVIYSSTVYPDKYTIVRFKNVTLEVPPGAVKEPVTLAINDIENVEKLDTAMENITEGSNGYRFLPHGMKFDKYIKVIMPYDKSKIDSEELMNLYTYFYNEETKKWEKLQRIGIDEEKGLVVSITNHFTDMINSVLKLPETAKPLSFNVNSIKDIKAANPSTNIPELKGLEPSPFGSASFQIPLTLPPGRNGMAPQLALSYNSSGGSGFIGNGFDIGIPSITIDTKMGLPNYDGNDDLSYNGEEIIKVSEFANESTYMPRKEGAFEKIVRKGTNKDNYYFEVTGKNGVVNLYGTDTAVLNGGKGILKWFLRQTTDLNGNTVVYNYETIDGYTYIKSIDYTGHSSGIAGKYHVVFNKAIKDDVRIDCRGKFVSKMKYRLTDVVIYYDTTKVRTYRMEYKYNEFGQSQLLKMIELGKDDGFFYSYDFSYYEMNKVNGEYDGFQEVERWENATGNLDQSQSFGGGGGVYAGIGFGYSYSMFYASLGVDVGFSLDYNYNLQNFLDINGDGLPDQVSQPNISQPLQCRLNNGSGFDSPISIGGTDKSLSSSFQGGFNIGVSGSIGPAKGSAGMGFSWTSAFSTMTDINGDGFIDIALPFNQKWLKGDGANGFKYNPWKVTTPNVTVGNTANTIGDLGKLTDAVHLLDPVVKWVPYHRGTVQIQGQIQKIDSTKYNYAKDKDSDGVKVNLYKNNDSIWTDNINNNLDYWNTKIKIGNDPDTDEIKRSYLLKDKDETYSHNDTVTINDLNDSIYFKVNSIEKIYNDTIKWNPEIQYTSIYYHEFMSDYDCVYIPQMFDVSSDAQAFNRFLNEISPDVNNLNRKFVQTKAYTPVKITIQIDETHTQEKIIKYVYNTNLTEEQIYKFKDILVGLKYLIPKKIEKDNFLIVLKSAIMKDNPATGVDPDYPDMMIDPDKYLTLQCYETSNYPYKLKNTSFYFLKENLSDSIKKRLCEIFKTIDYQRNYDKFIYAGKPYAVVKDNNNQYYIKARTSKTIENLKIMKQDNAVQPGDNTDKGIMVENNITGSGTKKYIKDNGNSVSIISLSDNIETVQTSGSDPDITFIRTDEDVLEVTDKSSVNHRTYTVTITEELPQEIDKDIYVSLHSEKLNTAIVPSTFTNNIINKFDLTDDRIYLKARYNENLDPSGDIIDYTLKNDLTNNDYFKVFNMLVSVNYMKSHYTVNGQYYIIKQGLSDTQKDEVKTLLVNHDIQLYKIVEGSIKVTSERVYSVNKEVYQSGIEEELILNRTYENNTKPGFTSFILLEDYDTNGKTIQKKEYIHVFDLSRDFTTNNIVNTNSSSNFAELDTKIYKNVFEEGILNKLSKQEDKNIVLKYYQLKNSYYILDEVSLSNNPEEKQRLYKVIINTGFGKEHFAGGIYNWYYGEWNGNLKWDKSRIGLINEDNNYLYYSTMDNTSDHYKLNCSLYGGTEFTYRDRTLGANGNQVDVEKYFLSYISSDEFNPSRKTGDSIDKIPGLSGGSTTLDLSGMDQVSNSFNFSTNIGGGVDVGGLGVSASLNNSITTCFRDLFDINGDRYPDQILFPVLSSGFTAIINRGGGFDSSKNYSNLFPGLRVSNSTTIGMGITCGPGGSNLKLEHTSKGDVKGSKAEKSASDKVSGSIGFNGSFGESRSIIDFQDINGDGLMDHVMRDGSGNYKVKLNTGDEFINYDDWESSEWGISVLQSDKLPGNPEALNYTNIVSGGFNLGASFPYVGLSASVTVSGNRTTADLIDMNGDGLLDQVLKKNADDHFYIKFNLGDRFADEAVLWHTPNWKSGNGDAFLIDNYVPNIIQAVFNQLNQTNGSSQYFGTSTFDFNGLQNSFGDSKVSNDITILGAGDVLSFNGGLGVSVGINFTIPINFGPLPIGITITPSGNFAYNLSTAQLKMADIDGDGLPDHVFKYDLDNYARVKLNNAKKVGLLKEIKTPQGGLIDIEYERTRNTVECPNSQYVMSKVIKKDGFTDGDSYATSYSYSGGKYVREEREFYGFNEIISTNPDGSSVTNNYYNDEYYKKGLNYYTESKTKEGITSNITENKYEDEIKVSTGTLNKDVVFMKLLETNITINDINGTESIFKSFEYSQYDGYGNVIKAIDKGNPSDNEDDINITLSYDYNTTKYLLLNPKQLEVTDRAGNILRKRTGKYDTKGNLIEVEQYLIGGSNSIYQFNYDNYGNIIKTIDPKGYTIDYTIDSVVHSYTLSIRDSFGYTSTATYNYSLGTDLTSTEIAGNTMIKQFDQFGRISKVFTDYDTSIPAVEFNYYPNEFPSRAVTKNKVHFDSTDSETLDTVIIIDGLNRIIQTKKEGEVTDPVTLTTTHGMNVTGKVIYDIMGREWKKGQPLFQNQYNLSYYTAELKNPTVSEYDSLGRIIKTSLPDTSITTTSYKIIDRKIKTEVIDPNGNKKISYINTNEMIEKIEQFNNNQKITTTYEYNLLNEITKITDTKGYITTITYDSLGRRTSINNPDSGLIENFYDVAGNLIKKMDNNLRNSLGGIVYNYEYNRLTKIDYPGATVDVEYEYGSPGSSNNTTGRIKQVKNESGITFYEYGKLGEETKVTKVLNRLTPFADNLTCTTEYGYDYLGRMEWIKYPDNETVTYTYDQGGSVKSVTGVYEGTAFNYIKNIGYDEFGQRVYIKYGNDVETRYTYSTERRWLSLIKTNFGSVLYQNMSYTFDKMGNILSTHNAGTDYDVKQNYQYDDLYQLINASGYYQNKTVLAVKRTNEYKQSYNYDSIGNMTRKTSYNLYKPENIKPNHLNYTLNYTYDTAKPHQATQIGDWRYKYDLNGNLLKKYKTEGNVIPQDTEVNIVDTDENSIDVDAALGWNDKPVTVKETVAAEYKWDEENRLKEAITNGKFTYFLYNSSGERTIKKSETGETIYVDKTYQYSIKANFDVYTKHIFLGNTRLVSKLSHNIGDQGIPYQQDNTYYYHGDHLGNTNFITDRGGAVFEHIEYMPYGETWLEESKDTLEKISWQFTSKELDKETGLYYFGARYLEPQTSMWISCDPIFNKYLPNSPITEEDKNYNKNLPGMGGIYNIINLSLYHYSGNNPLKYNDPSGNAAVLAIPFIAAADLIAALCIAAAVLATIAGIMILEKTKAIDKIKEMAQALSISQTKKIEQHHSFPMFLGGPVAQPLVPMEQGRHQELHKDLGVFLDTFYPGMRPKAGNPGAIIQQKFGFDTRLNAMAQFYLMNIDKYPDAAAMFFTQYPQTLNDKNVQWVKDNCFGGRLSELLFGLFTETTPE